MSIKRFTAYTLIFALSFPLLGCSSGDPASQTSSETEAEDPDLEAPTIELPGDDPGTSESTTDDEGSSEG